MKTFDTQIKFLEKAKNKHGDKYDYSSVIYIKSSEKINIICKIHGSFLQVANSHILGHGCAKCGFEKISKERQKNNDLFINECKVIHGNTYNYDLVNYKGSKKNIELVCKIHGKFKKLAESVLKGEGCQRCVTDTFNKKFFSKNKQAYFYFIECIGDKESFFKIGITSRDVKYRFKKFPYNIKVIKIINNTADIIWNLESKVKRYLYDFKYRPLIHFNGHTECFMCDQDKINNIIQQVLNE